MSFGGPHLVSHAGLVPVVALTEQAGAGLVGVHVRPGGASGADSRLEVASLVAGMAAGADSVDGMGVLRHGAMGAVFSGVRPVDAITAPEPGPQQQATPA